MENLLYILFANKAFMSVMDLPQRPDDEKLRLQSLYALNILDTPAEEPYDNLVRILRINFDMPVVAISLIDSHRQWFKAITGLDICETSREISFCGHTINQNDLFIIEDTYADKRFKDNPLVTLNPKIRFYAGMPIQSPEGHNIGTICLIDMKPRTFTAKSGKLLQLYKPIVERELLQNHKHYSYLQHLDQLQKNYIQGVHKKELAKNVLDFIVEETGSEYGFIGEITPGNNNKSQLVVDAVSKIMWSMQNKQVYRYSSTKDMICTNINSLYGHTLRTGERVVANDPFNHPVLVRKEKRNQPAKTDLLPDFNETMTLKSYLGLPIYGRGGLIGMIGLANRKKGYDDYVINHLTLFTNMAVAILESSRARTELDNSRKTDNITGLYKRDAFYNLLSGLINQGSHAEPQQSFGLLSIDIDNFRSVNNIYGKAFGDGLLITIAKTLNRHSGNHTVARIGGDEFMILCPRICDPEALTHYAEQICELLQNVFERNQLSVTLKPSLGIASYPDSAATLEQLLQRLDIALYKAKQSFNKIAVHDSEFEALYKENIFLEECLKHSIAHDQFYYLYQPQISSTTHDIIGAEALIRWHSPTEKYYGPDRFITILEKLGLARELNLYTLRKVINDISTQYAIFGNTFKISINVSPHVRDISEHLNEIKEVLSYTYLPDNIHIEIEITEADLMDHNILDNAGFKSMLEQLQDCRIGIAIDDFGVRYSSINRLIDYSFTTLKIDKAFTDRIDQSKSSGNAIIQAIVDLGKSLQLKIVAEGVETLDQAVELEKMGCDILQGYYFSRPVSFQELTRQLRQQNTEAS